MIWYILALMGAFFSASYYLINKKLIKKIDKYSIGFGVYFVACIFTFLVLLYQGIPEIKTQFFFGYIGSLLTVFISFLLLMNAFKKLDFSLAMPMIAFTPLFLILTSYVLLQETLSWLGVVGIVLVVIGSYFLNMKHNKGFLYPFIHLFKNKALFSMFIVAVLYSLAANFDKIMILNSSVSFSYTLLYGSLSLLFLPFLVMKRKRIADIKINWKMLSLAGFFMFLVIMFIGTALLLGKVPYIISIKRFSILFSEIFAFFILKEDHIRQRFFAALLMVAGAILIGFA